MKNSDKTENEINVMEILNGILNRKWLLINTILAFTFGAIIFAYLSPKVYQTDALMQIDEKSSSMSTISDMMPILEESSVEAEIELIKSRMILGKVIDKLKLDISIEPSYLPFVGKAFASKGYAAPSMFSESEYVWAGEKILIETFEIGENFLGIPFDIVSLGGKKYELKNEEIGFSYFGDEGVPLLDSTINLNLNVISIPERKNVKNTVTKVDRYLLIQGLAKSIRIIELGKKTGIIRLSVNGENKNRIRDFLQQVTEEYLLQNVKKLSAEAENSLVFLRENLPKAEARMIESQEKLSNFQMKNKSVDLTMETKGLLDQMITIDKQLSEATFKENEIKNKFTPEHPIYQALLGNKQELSSKKGNINHLLRKLPISQQEYLKLKRDLEVDQEIYIQLLNKIQELEIVKAGTVGNIRIIDSADINPRPIKPKKKKIVLFGIVLGVMTGLALVFLFNFFQNGVEGPDQIESIGMNVYASVPFSPVQLDLSKKENLKKIKGQDLILAEEYPSDTTVEALRNFRTGLHFAMMEAVNNIVMISGPSPNIGKSFISVNLAVTCASAKQKILLIDADLRKGYLHRFFKQKKGEGLSDLILKNLNFEDVVRETRIENLDFIERGEVPTNPSELLMSSKFEELLTWASEHYDIILVDTPPILAVTDAAIVGKFTGTNFLVTRFKVNSLKEIEASVNRFESTGIKISGAILNGIMRTHGGYKYGDYGYGYYNYEYKTESSEKA